MDAEQARKLLRGLPHVAETMQWGANLVYWTGDKAVGGKMFALINLDEERNPEKPAPVLSFYAGPQRYPELLESGSFLPAPYMARIYWAALLRWNDVSRAELEPLLRLAHAGVFERLPRRTQELLAMPKAARDAAVEQRKKVLAARARKANSGARSTAGTGKV